MNTTRSLGVILLVTCGFVAGSAAAAGDPAGALTPSDVVTLAQGVKGSDEGSRAARAALTVRVAEEYLSGPEAARAMPPGDWEKLVGLLGADLAPEARSLWIERLRAAFGPAAGVIEPASAGGAASLILALQRLGDRQAAAWAMDFDQAWDARCRDEPFSEIACRAIKEAWLRLGREDLAAKWAARERVAPLETDRKRMTAEVADLFRVAERAWEPDLVSRGRTYPEFLVAVSRLIETGRLDMVAPENLRRLSLLLGSEESQTFLKTGIVAPDGAPRRGALTLLAFSYLSAGEGAKWREFTRAKVAGPGMKADARARWMLAIAQVEGSIRQERRPDLEWLNRAFAAAESPAFRFEILREIVKSYVLAAKYSSALEAIDLAAGRFTQKEAAAVADLRKEVAAGQKAFEAQRLQAKAAAAVRLRQAPANHLVSSSDTRPDPH